MSTPRRKYLNYTTPWGVDLARAAQAGWSSFLIHECGYQSALDDWNHQGVDSPFWRFYFNPRPGCHLLFGGRPIPLGPDSCVLIPADTLFDCCGPVAACHLWLHFTVSHPGGAIQPAPVLIPMDTVLQTLADTVIATHQMEPGEARDQRLLHESAALLHVAYARAPFPAPRSLPGRLLETIALIQRTPHSDLSNPLLAARAGMSVEAFIRAFRHHTGQTPAAYVSATRIRLAEQLLALTEKSIDQIAIECGFPNRHYLSRVFAKRIGCGPAEFRARQHRRKGI